MNYNIRLASKNDVADILEIYAPIIKNTATSFEYAVPDDHEMWKRIAHVLTEAPWLVCTHKDKVIGYAYSTPHRSRTAYQWSRELSVYVHTNYRGRFIATALYHVLISLLRNQGYINTYIGITLPNEPSVRFHEKMGYKLVGIYEDVGYKQGAFHSVGWWQKKISDALPSKIIKVNELRSETWQAAVERGVALII